MKFIILYPLTINTFRSRFLQSGLESAYLKEPLLFQKLLHAFSFTANIKMVNPPRLGVESSTPFYS